MTDFYSSAEWKKLRAWALKKYGRKCRSCGSTSDIEVDHILPRSLYPKLKLNKDNVQILCSSCNKVKSNVYVDDLRPFSARLWFWAIKWVKRLLVALLAVSLALLLHVATAVQTPSYSLSLLSHCPAVAFLSTLPDLLGKGL